MARKYLTKSDYNRWQFCPTSAYYGWQSLPSKNDDDSFLKFLVEEGRTVGRMARRLFERGHMIDSLNTEKAEEITKGLLQRDGTLYEACVTHGCFVARPDVLIRKGSTLYLVEAKSKIGNLRQHREGKMLINMYGDVRAAYKEIVHDLAFQVEILRRAYPDLTVVPYFLLPEEHARAGEDEAQAARKREDIVLSCDETTLKDRRSESVLKFFPAGKAIEKIQVTTAATMEAMAEAWKSGQRPQPKLKYGCRNCEFRLKAGDKADGFHQCWGKLAEPSPHIFDLHQLYALKAPGNKQALLADEKIRAGATSLFDVKVDELHGEHAHRQRMQLEYQRSGDEWIDPQLGEEIAKLSWPIAFVDFETTMAAIPWHAGLKPYETLPFQFSAHILHEDGSFEHKEWLNTEDREPTLPFIRELRKALETVGSVLVYTSYENRILSEAIGRLNCLYQDESKAERAWIADLLNSGRIIDQHEWVHRHHGHCRMAGRTSIKVVLPAIWQNNASLHSHEYFKRYFREENGKILDPYKTLRSASIFGVPFDVREGCGAMRAYREIIIGSGASCPKTKTAIAELLRNYVTLDTASQWILFEHWQQHFSEGTTSGTSASIGVS